MFKAEFPIFFIVSIYLLFLGIQVGFKVSSIIVYLFAPIAVFW